MKKKSLNAKKIIHKKLLKYLKNKKIKKIYNIFSDNLENYKNFQKLAIALSGGQDSLALAYLAKCYSIINKHKIYFYHVDHGLRKESSKEAFKLKSKIQNFGINCEILKWKGIKPKSNIQSIARVNRYDLIKKKCIKNNIKLLLTGHHLEDVYENFFIRLLRGSGLKGLISFYSIETKNNKSFKILRPLKQIKKKELAYLSSLVFNFFINDSSNTNLYFKRIRIRELLLNLKKEGFDENKFNITLANLASSEKTINYYVNKNLKVNTYLNKNKTYIISNEFFQNPNEIVFRSLSMVLQIIGNSYYPSRGKNLQNLISRLKLKNFKKTTLSGCIIEKFNNSIKIYKER